MLQGSNDLQNWPLAAEFSEKCLGEEPAPCQAACPLHIDNKRMVELIGRGAFEEALDVVLERLPFPRLLGRVCRQRCERFCRRKDVEAPVAICSLKRFIADLAPARLADRLPSPEPEREIKVAVVGGGPAGVMAAYELRLKGYSVDLFESGPALGGATYLYIPKYRLERQVLAEEFGILEKMGVLVRLGVTLGKDVHLDGLRSEYKAVLLALGAHESVPLQVPGEKLAGVLGALDFLRAVNGAQPVDVGTKVAVVGGGDAAIDAARTARSMGAESVTVLYRRSSAEMPALPGEVEEAHKEGVVIEYLVSPVALVGEGRVSAIRCVRNELGPACDASGRRQPVPLEGSEFTLPVDGVIVAVGQSPTRLTSSSGDNGLARTASSAAQVNPVTLETTLRGVFAAGDFATGPESVVRALASGRQVAWAIDRFLQGDERQDLPLVCAPWTTRLKVSIQGKVAEPRCQVPVLPLAERRDGGGLVELGFSAEQARREAQRCLSCECRGCMKVCSFLSEYTDSPKQLAEELPALGNERLVVPYTCNVCGLCRKVCPEDLDTGELCAEGRTHLLQEGRGPLPQHRPVRLHQKLGTSRQFRLAMADPRSGKCKRVLFPGCSLPSYSPALVVSSYEYLLSRLDDVGVVLNCCGKPSRTLGDNAAFERLIGATAREITGLGATEIIFACTNCYMIFGKFTPDFRIRMLYEVMKELGLPEPVSRLPQSAFTVHDSCPARDNPGLQLAVREMIRSMGHGLEEMEYSGEKTRCCGLGGMAWAANPKFVDRVITARAEEAPRDIVTFCAGCRMAFASVRKPALHVLDLLFNENWAEQKNTPPPSGLKRWMNRWTLKRSLSGIAARSLPPVPGGPCAQP
ncbi:MAG: FAD-dependent oxidoreductase [Deltaproteobacteria bacterium]|nr:FAD-dependent oxidoreductase [Deltaproteobacteria bacterium]